MGGVAGARGMLLPTRQLYFISARPQQFCNHTAVIALNFNALRVDRTARSARALEITRQLRQFCRRTRQPQQNRHRFTAPPLRLPPYAHETIGRHR